MPCFDTPFSVVSVIFFYVYTAQELPFFFGYLCHDGLPTAVYITQFSFLLSSYHVFLIYISLFVNLSHWLLASPKSVNGNLILCVYMYPKAANLGRFSGDLAAMLKLSTQV